MKSKLKLKLYNTETKAKEEIVPLDGKRILMYTCGPTVYNFAHIGNFRTYVFEDLLRRTIKFFGMPVRQVMNITDIDDKTLKGAIDNDQPLREFTEPYTEAFFEDLKTLNIEPVEAYPRATDFVQEMITVIERLIAKGYAYAGLDKSIYFAIHRFPSYGRLSHLPIDELRAGASERIIVDEYDKERISDFALWKSYDPQRDGAIYWDSPFGPGRPGWHIECSCMAMQLLGETIDIHVGGIDNMFPHHENEIAQSEAFSGKQFVKHWLHSEHLLVEHRKMSKSLGNFYTLRDLLQKGYTGPQIRYMLLHAHYRTQLNFTFEGLDGAVATLQRLADFIARLRAVQERTAHHQVQPLIDKTLETFTAALADDLNISPALAALFDFVREVNSLCDQNKVSQDEAQRTLVFLEKLDQVLAVLPLHEATLEIPQELQEAFERREKARTEKNWKVADECRALIYARGYLIEDTPSGPRLKKAK